MANLWSSSFPDEKIVRLNTILKNYAVANEMRHLDYFLKLLSKRKGLKAAFVNDGVIPSKAGYQAYGIACIKGNRVSKLKQYFT